MSDDAHDDRSEPSRAPSDPDTESETGDGVGYGRPPKHTRFKPGQSGNMHGRPRGARNRKVIVEEIAHETHKITEGGKRRQRSTIELVLILIRNSALSGKARDFRFFDDLLARLEPQAAVQGGYVVMPEPEASAEEWAERWGITIETVEDDPETFD